LQIFIFTGSFALSQSGFTVKFYGFSFDFHHTPTTFILDIGLTIGYS